MKILPAIFALALPALSMAAETAECPLTLPGESVMVFAPDGWTGGQSKMSMALTEFGMMAGAPETKNYLRAKESKTVKLVTHATWRFEPAQEKWLFCRYGFSNAFQISKRLDDANSECTIRHVEDKSGNIVSAVATCS